MNVTEIRRRAPVRHIDESTDIYNKRLDKFCAEWAVATLEDLEWKQMPYKPAEVLRHEEIAKEVRRGQAVLEPEYWKSNSVVLAYYDAVRAVRNENQSKFDWLLQCRKELTGVDEERIAEKLREVKIDMLWPKGGYR